jgi:hypothetical protein
MFTVKQCLDKAIELDRRAAEPLPPDIRAEFAAMALQWRRLAARALIQDQRAAMIERPEA